MRSTESSARPVFRASPGSERQLRFKEVGLPVRELADRRGTELGAICGRLRICLPHLGGALGWAAHQDGLPFVMRDV